jgi:cytochrome c-type biogenesis protein CcmE
MKSRHKKLALIGGALALIGIITFFVMNALQSNLAFYISPTDVVNGKAPAGKLFRIGGMVKEGSVARQADGVTIAFVVTDTEHDITVHYKGILPDLFKEGKGVTAQGRLTADGHFTASDVLAKHDENYMPPEAAKAVGDAHARAAEKKAAETPDATPEPASGSANTPAPKATN